LRRAKIEIAIESFVRYIMFALLTGLLLLFAIRILRHFLWMVVVLVFLISLVFRIVGALIVRWEEVLASVIISLVT
jgi:hypothetical protein